MTTTAHNAIRRAMPHMVPVVPHPAIKSLQEELAAARADGLEAVKIGHELVQFVRELLEEIEFQESLVDELLDKLLDHCPHAILDELED